MARLRTTILLTVAMFAASNLTAEAFIAEAPSESQQTPTESPHTGADDRLRQELDHLWNLITDPYREFIGKIIFTVTNPEDIYATQGFRFNYIPHNSPQYAPIGGHNLLRLCAHTLSTRTNRPPLA